MTQPLALWGNGGNLAWLSRTRDRRRGHFVIERRELKSLTPFDDRTAPGQSVLGCSIVAVAWYSPGRSSLGNLRIPTMASWPEGVCTNTEPPRDSHPIGVRRVRNGAKSSGGRPGIIRSCAEGASQTLPVQRVQLRTASAADVRQFRVNLGKRWVSEKSRNRLRKLISDGSVEQANRGRPAGNSPVVAGRTPQRWSQPLPLSGRTGFLDSWVANTS
jgi:hypothetical protein